MGTSERKAETRRESRHDNDNNQPVILGRPTPVALFNSDNSFGVPRTTETVGRGPSRNGAGNEHDPRSERMKAGRGNGREHNESVTSGFTLYIPGGSLCMGGYCEHRYSD